MSMDWKDALSQLKDAMPEPADTNPTDETDGTDVQPEVNMAKKSKGKLNISLEKKGRGGKMATIIYGFAETVSDDEIDDLARTLKQKLGIGGSSRDGEILLQGDCRVKASELLRGFGYKI